MIRRLLLALDGAYSTQTAIQHSMDMYQKSPCFVSALAILDRHGIIRERESRRVGNTSFFDGQGGSLLEAEEKKMMDMLGRFTAYSGRCGLSHMDREIDHGSVEDLIQRSKYFDIITMGIDALLPFGEKDPELTIRRIVQESCCPVLGLPTRYRPIRRVAICFNGSMPSARVMQQYARLNPFDVDVVHILSIGNPEEPNSLPMACDFLRAHGYQVHIAKLQGSVHKAIPQYLQEQNIDLVALGPNSGTIKKFFFGSLTETLLAQKNTAVFLYN